MNNDYKLYIYAHICFAKNMSRNMNLDFYD